MPSVAFFRGKHNSKWENEENTDIEKLMLGWLTLWWRIHSILRSSVYLLYAIEQGGKVIV